MNVIEKLVVQFVTVTVIFAFAIYVIATFVVIVYVATTLDIVEIHYTVANI